ncbi:glycerophosphodiester phosphodiesterase [Paenibacillus sp. LHD-38]|uniref:glycerophosphodiester phosphodiesterase n=1 Tax=Paenibacillus sp. LHD-38 TaxID=3072143 RepID=UPI00280F2A71|nr:glycerophosphodiester phosphodiesterase [Paenibacillus sp. LHD-38]MDQ8734711.1 glycerophosphodiester phosphodiesterase [Paenibacillus sp. LHD-38]
MINQTRVLVAAHTGCGNAPDNTTDSFLEGVDSGADIVEVDIRVTNDGTAILLHDDTPLLRAYTYEQLNQQEIRVQLDPVYEKHEIPRLDDILQLAAMHKVKLNLDIKDKESIEPAMESIKRFEHPDRLFITGCSDGITRHNGGIQVLMNTPDELAADEELDYEAFALAICEQAQHEGYYGINMNYRTCRKEIVDIAHARNLAVWVYTVDDPIVMKIFIQMKVDAITTRKVEGMLEIRK